MLHELIVHLFCYLQIKYYFVNSTYFNSQYHIL